MKPRRHHEPIWQDGHRTRLAQSAVAAVDVCTCGTMQLHIGALSVRMSPEALSQLLGTLGRAVAVHAAGRLEHPALAVGTTPRERGQA